MYLNIQRALFEAIEASDLSVRDKFRLRLACRFPRFMERIKPDIEDLLVHEGFNTTGPMEAVDWAKLIKFFIEYVLPLLLDLL